MLGGFRSREINTHPEIITSHIQLSMNFNLKKTHYQMTAWLTKEKTQHHLYKFLTLYSQFVIFFLLMIGFLKLNPRPRFLKDESQKAFLPRILPSRLLFSLMLSLLGGLLSHLQCVRQFAGIYQHYF